MIDYEAIAKKADEKTRILGVSIDYVKAVIDAYEAQKAPPEWVPLDLATVKQGQEVRNMSWPNKPENHTRKFVAAYEGGLVLEYQGYISKYGHQKPEEWLMRAPKPKTVRVRVWKSSSGKLGVFIDDEGPVTDNRYIVGEGDIKVTE